MKCPKCTSIEMEKVHYPRADVMSCPQCDGVWASESDLNNLKSAEDEYLGWVELDLWRNHEHSAMKHSDCICPECGKKMYTLRYPETDIEIDVCDSCQSVWLDKGEFKKLIDYLEDRLTGESISSYLKDVSHELKEVVVGNEELSDLLKVMKLLEYRIFAAFPAIAKMISKLPPA